MTSDRRAAILLSVLVLISGGCSSPEVTVARFSGTTMGTTYQVTYRPAASSLEEIHTAVAALLEEINASLSTYIEASLISRINASWNLEEWHPADRHFEAVFFRSGEIYRDTDGAFNPAVGPLVNAWGFGPDGPQATPDDTEVGSLLALVDFESFEWREYPPAVRKHRTGAQLDFSAIAKGYGVDEVGRFLEEQGVASYFVEIGGEVRTRGMHPEGRPWRIGIERPEEGNAGGEIQSVLSVNDAALATSGNYRNYTIEDGRRIVHIMNPSTGYPETTSLLSVSVLAPDTMTADAYATAFMVMGLEASQAFVEDHADIEAYLISAAAEGTYAEWRSSGFPPPPE